MLGSPADLLLRLLSLAFFDGPPPPFGATRQACSINFRKCFGSFWSQSRPKASAEDIFKRIAFELPFCGDCSSFFDFFGLDLCTLTPELECPCLLAVLSSLIQVSGPLGLNSLLPSEDIVVTSRASPFGADPGQSFLPLTPGWRVADFSVESVINQAAWGETVVLRDWCAQLIARYAWTVVCESRFWLPLLRTTSSLTALTFGSQPTPPRCSRWCKIKSLWTRSLPRSRPPRLDRPQWASTTTSRDVTQRRRPIAWRNGLRSSGE